MRSDLIYLILEDSVPFVTSDDLDLKQRVIVRCLRIMHLINHFDNILEVMILLNLLPTKICLV